LCNRQGINVDWPEPPVEFPITEGNWDPEFPVLMFPWGGGQPLIYSIEDQYTYFSKAPPKWWVYPNTQTHLFGEEYRLGMGAIKFGLAFLYNLSGGGPSGNGIQIDAATWLINDIYRPDLDANQRSYEMVNLPAQPEGVGIVRPVQVSDAENFNRYLESFKDSGFIGGLLRPLDHMYGEDQFAVISKI
jgi:hypothetical protein